VRAVRAYLPDAQFLAAFSGRKCQLGDDWEHRYGIYYCG
jgi:hypothetical protein